MVDHVYQSCVVTINRFDTIIDLLLMDMVDFEVILGMNSLSTYYAILDFHSKFLALAMLGLPRLEWRGSLGHAIGRVISFLMAQTMVAKGCLAYLAFILYVIVEVPFIDFV